MVQFEFEAPTATPAIANVGSGSWLEWAAKFRSEMAAVPLTDFDVRTLILIVYLLASVAFVCLIACACCRTMKRNEIERKWKKAQ